MFQILLRLLEVFFIHLGNFRPHGSAGGGFSPVCLTSLSVVTVVLPPGVVVTVSVFVDDSSLAQPPMPIENKLSIRAAQAMLFMFEISYLKFLVPLRKL
jgi:hypothetical protein